MSFESNIAEVVLGGVVVYGVAKGYIAAKRFFEKRSFDRTASDKLREALRPNENDRRLVELAAQLESEIKSQQAPH